MVGRVYLVGFFVGGDVFVFYWGVVEGIVKWLVEGVCVFSSVGYDVGI